MTPTILDPCSGSRMMWFDKSDQRALFGDCRSEEHFLPDRQYTRHIEIKPDIKLDFRKLPFPDNSFKLIAFDPPHLVNEDQIKTDQVLALTPMKPLFGHTTNRRKQTIWVTFMKD